jgi:diacylglycerol kinase (ATP)
MQVWLVVNSTDGDALDALKTGAKELRAAGHQVQARVTFEGGDAARMAGEAAAAGAELVVACGGDGTLNQVANGLYDWAAGVDAADDPSTLPRLGIVPLGTANDLANGVGVPADVPGALALAVSGRAREIDVGVVNGQRFLNVSTGGFGADATDRAGDDAKRVLGSLAYVLRGVQELVELEIAHGRFHADGELIHDGPFLFFAVGNGPRTGGGNLLTPHADLSDGLLDVCVVPELTRVALVALAPQLRSGRHTDNDDVIYRQVRELVVEAQEPLRVNADGEPLEGRRFTYRIEPRRLRLMVP